MELAKAENSANNVNNAANTRGGSNRGTVHCEVDVMVNEDDEGPAVSVPVV